MPGDPRGTQRGPWRQTREHHGGRRHFLGHRVRDHQVPVQPQVEGERGFRGGTQPCHRGRHLCAFGADTLRGGGRVVVPCQGRRDLAKSGDVGRGQLLELTEQGGDRVGGRDRGAQAGDEESLAYEVREQVPDSGGRGGREVGGELFGENCPLHRCPCAVHGHADRRGRADPDVRGDTVSRAAGAVLDHQPSVALEREAGGEERHMGPERVVFLQPVDQRRRPHRVRSGDRPVPGTRSQHGSCPCAGGLDTGEQAERSGT